MSCFCGAIGVSDTNLLNRMSQIMLHRGPDGENHYLDSNIMLSQRVLNISGLERSKKPLSNEDDSLFLVSSGRILNYKTLRRELEERGHVFKTDCDAEVILHSYEEFPPDFMKLFNGAFAFALWDSTNKSLLLTRDRNGIEPLYYHLTKEEFFFFASEIKSILQFEEVERTLDLEAFHLFVNLRYVPLEKTLLEGITRVLPGQYVIVDKQGLHKRKYFHFKYVPEEKSLDYFVREVRSRLQKAVEMQFTEDAGILLSGGVDSSILVALASNLSNSYVKTFTMGFGEVTDEVEDAKRVAEYFGTDHRELIIRTHLLRDYPQMIWYADLPKRNLYPYYIYQLAGKRCKTLLAGLGLDELFGGYPWKYEYALSVEKTRKRVDPAKRKALSSSAKDLIINQIQNGDLEDDYILEYLKKIYYIEDDTDLYLEIKTLDEVFSNHYLSKIYGKNMKKFSRQDIKKHFSSLFTGGSLVKQFMAADYQVKAVDDFIFTETTMAAANSVDTRLPFLENSLVDLAFRIPVNFKWRGGEGKYILVKAAKTFLPRWIFKKKKQGFGGDPSTTYKNEIYEIAKQRLPEGIIVQKDLIQKSFLDKILRHKITPRLRKHYCLLWSLLMFEAWYEIFMNKSQLEIPKQGLDDLFS